MQKQKGFTIIELIVVIAIIAVLAAIVLVNVTGYINKSKNAAIKGNMATILVNGAAHFDQYSSYTTFTASTKYTVPAAAVNSAGGAITPQTALDGTAYCACSTMLVTPDALAGSTYCVDSSGAKVQKVQTCAVACPSTGICAP